ncbi:MAG: DNA-processing protein DprA [Treponema sp.]|nr:DNA-processing protein DprA [Treponema sp.]
MKFQEKNILAKKIQNIEELKILSMLKMQEFLKRDIKSKDSWNPAENFRMAERALNYCQKLNIQLLLNEDLEYPELLRQIADPPYLLFCRGDINILADKSVSVVGTRRITPQGKIAAKEFAYNAVLDSCNVISGLANGADGFAHQGAIDAYFDYCEKGLDTMKLGKTIAVMPTSIDQITPSSHKKMASQIIQSGGLLISEYEPGLPMATWHFVGRNRIIAGLSPATLVVEAPAGSGALITADFALENGRDVFFHQVSFNESAQKIDEISKNTLDKAFEQKKVSKFKKENTIEKYIEAGAPVIKDYKDYCQVLKEMPGKRALEMKQGELFKLD